MGSSLTQVTCERSQVLLAGGQVVFLRDLPFSPCLNYLMFDMAQMSEIILTKVKLNEKKKSAAAALST